jgi:hypothetical protein
MVIMDKIRSEIRSSMSSIPEDRWELAFGKKDKPKEENKSSEVVKK